MGEGGIAREEEIAFEQQFYSWGSAPWYEYVLRLKSAALWSTSCILGLTSLYQKD